jgi:murein DD-endopeptidase MepM/ murein hydrolase activator NlpD
MKYCKPFSGRYPLTSSWGWRTHKGKREWHTGLDYGCPVGTSLYCVDGGVVTFAGQDQFGGLYIDVKADSDGGVTRFLHCSELLAKAGERVKTGQLIAKSGNTGNSSGPHLHLEFVSNINPRYAHINQNTGAFDSNFWAEPEWFKKPTTVVPQGVRPNYAVQIIGDISSPEIRPGLDPATIGYWQSLFVNQNWVEVAKVIQDLNREINQLQSK